MAIRSSINVLFRGVGSHLHHRKILHHIQASHFHHLGIKLIKGFPEI